MKNKSSILSVRSAVMFLIAAMSVLAVPRAQAHARLTRSVPESGASPAQAPTQISLWFNELLDGGDFNSIAVFPSSEANSKTRTDLTAGKARVDSKDRTHLTVTLKPLPSGEYTVEWRVLSLDGHTAPGRYKFKVVAPN